MHTSAARIDVRPALRRYEPESEPERNGGFVSSKPEIEGLQNRWRDYVWMLLLAMECNGLPLTQEDRDGLYASAKLAQEQEGRARPSRVSGDPEGAIPHIPTAAERIDTEIYRAADRLIRSLHRRQSGLVQAEERASA
jgi:hypothetical protein